MRDLQTIAPDLQTFPRNRGAAPYRTAQREEAVEVADLAAGSSVVSASVMSGLLGAYQEQGYEQGYRRGVADVLAQLLVLTEQYLREQPAAGESLRRSLYGFEAYVEHHLQPRGDGGFVSGGLGI
jgi:hypothetical protein